MSRYNLWIATFTALYTIWDALHLVAIPNWASSGHLRRCSMADSHIKSLSRGIVRYDMVLECCSRPSQIGPHQVTYDAVAWLIHI
eukprot:scaffold11426_cov128-Skeletonema_marinoi.AAC.7